MEELLKKKKKKNRIKTIYNHERTYSSPFVNKIVNETYFSVLLPKIIHV